eukprot:gene4739-9411_t
MKICTATCDDIEPLSVLEGLYYPSDEAASYETMIMRQAVAGEYFLVMKSNENSIVGFINATRSHDSTIHHSSMTSHEKDGKSLIIHSVVIEQSQRREGLAQYFLKSYVETIRNYTDIDQILLLSKGYLLSLYNKCGFTIVGISSVTHGKEPWFEMSIKLNDIRYTSQYQVDAFTDKAFSGNPAAVVLTHKSPEWMLKVAEENNLAETAFLQIRKNELYSYDLRWFTPTKEVELCGHATLASAHTLYELNKVPKSQTIHFHTLHSGILTASIGSDNTVILNFPSVSPVILEQISINEEYKYLEIGLGIHKEDIIYMGRNTYDLFVEISPQSFIDMIPRDFSALVSLGGRGVIITCTGARQRQRQICFFPRYGINEDPVTGSAHCALAPYWCTKLNQTKLLGYQASKRGGQVDVTLDGDRVHLSGPSVTTIESKILV